MIDIVFEPIAKFFGTHAKFIIGVIVNIISKTEVDRYTSDPTSSGARGWL